MVRMPETVSSSIPGIACSYSSWRQRPHGMSVLPSPSTQTNATSLPPPDMNRSLTSEHSAHSVTPYEAFSMLQPETIRPSETSAAAPTRKREYGAYARCIASVAAARSSSQSMSVTRLTP